VRVRSERGLAGRGRGHLSPGKNETGSDVYNLTGSVRWCGAGKALHPASSPSSACHGMVGG
jgi:hypothetical protein